HCDGSDHAPQRVVLADRLAGSGLWGRDGGWRRGGFGSDPANPSATRLEETGDHQRLAEPSEQTRSRAGGSVKMIPHSVHTLRYAAASRQRGSPPDCCLSSSLRTAYQVLLYERPISARGAPFLEDRSLNHGFHGRTRMGKK